MLSFHTMVHIYYMHCQCQPIVYNIIITIRETVAKVGGKVREKSSSASRFLGRDDGTMVGLCGYIDSVYIVHNTERLTSRLLSQSVVGTFLLSSVLFLCVRDWDWVGRRAQEFFLYNSTVLSYYYLCVLYLKLRVKVEFTLSHFSNCVWATFTINFQVLLLGSTLLQKNPCCFSKRFVFFFSVLCSDKRCLVQSSQKKCLGNVFHEIENINVLSLIHIHVPFLFSVVVWSLVKVNNTWHYQQPTSARVFVFMWTIELTISQDFRHCPVVFVLFSSCV